MPTTKANGNKKEIKSKQAMQIINKSPFAIN